MDAIKNSLFDRLFSNVDQLTGEINEIKRLSEGKLLMFDHNNEIVIQHPRAARKNKPKIETMATVKDCIKILNIETESLPKEH